jgi:hypothetical protein
MRGTTRRTEHRAMPITTRKAPMTTRLLAAAVAAAAGIAILAATSDAQDPAGGPATLNLTVSEQRCTPVDDGRRGDSLGDRNFCAGTLRGDETGRVRWTCTYQGTERLGDHCTASVALRRGTLEAAGPLSHTRPQSTWAVIGGTGGLAGARGTVELTQRSATRVEARVTLLR